MLHIKNRHSANFKCDHCNKIFDNKIEQKRHIKEEHILKDKQYVCPICGKTSKSKHFLRHHIPLHGPKKYKCEYCEKAFHQWIGLHQHLRTHTGEKPYICPVCDTGYSTLNILNNHKLIHTGEKPHQCKICGKAYSQKTNLKTHMKSHLNGNIRVPAATGISLVSGIKNSY